MVTRPDNNLGTAHGRIVIDYEDRGSNDANAALVKLQKEFDALNQRLAKVESSFKKNTISVEKNSTQLKKASSSARSYIATIFGLDRVHRIFDKDVVDLTKDLTTLIKKFNELNEKTEKLQTLYKILDRFQKIKPNIRVDVIGRGLQALNLSGLAQGERNLKILYKALDSVGLGLQGAKEATKNWFLGTRQAFLNMPTWARSFTRIAQILTALGAAGVLVGQKLDAGFINKFLNTNVFRKIVVETNKAGGAFEKLGNISQKVFGRNLFGGFAQSLKNSEINIETFVKNSSTRLNFFSKVFNKTFAPISKFANEAKSFIFGAALLKKGLTDIINKFSWIGRIPKPLLMGLGVVISSILPAAFQLLNKTLIVTANLLVGLWDGIKQISGGVLVLPGALAQIGIIAGTLKTIFGGFKDYFKDVFSTDPVAAAEAFAKLPEHLRPLASALKDVVWKFRELQTSIQKLAFKNVESQIKSLSEKYIPILKSGMTGVTFSLRDAKDEFVKFLEQGQTQKDTNKLFSQTAETIASIAKSIQPALQGLRNIGMVGSEFITTMSSGLPGIVQKFAEWTRLNRETGRMMQWMQDSRKGIVDLTKGTLDLTRSLWQMLTIFKSNPNTNWLSTYVQKMKELRGWTEKSSKVGILYDLGEGVRRIGLGRDKIQSFMELFRTLIKTFNAVAPVISNISKSFSSLFIPVLDWALRKIGLFAQVLETFGGDTFIGFILGLVAAIRLTPAVFKPLKDGAIAAFGAFKMLKNAGGMIGAIETAIINVASWLETLGGVGAKAAKSMTNVATSTRGFASNLIAIGGPIAILASVILAVKTVMSMATENAKAFDEQIGINEKSVKDFTKTLNQGFLEDKGFVGRTVMDQVSNGLDTMLENLENTADKAPGFWDHIGDMFINGQKRAGSIPVEIPIIGQIAAASRDSDELNKRQADGDAAKLAAEKYKELIKAGIDLNTVIYGSKEAFDQHIKSIREDAEGGNELADVLVKYRTEFDLVKDSMQELGPLGIKVAEGLQKIAEAGGDATTKLEGLKLVLQGLGFLQVDAMEAAAEFADQISGLSDRVKEAVENGDGLTNVFTDLNKLNIDNSITARNLLPIFKSLSNAFLQMAASGTGSIDEMVGKIDGQLESVAATLNTSKEKIKDLLTTSFGITPEPIKILVQLTDKDPIVQQMGSLMAQLIATAETGVPVKLHFDNETALKDFQNKFNDVFGRDILSQSGLNLVLQPGVEISQEEMDRLKQFLAENGIQTVGGPPPPQAAQLPVNPGVSEPPKIGPPSSTPNGAILPDTGQNIYGIPLPPEMRAAPPRLPEMGPSNFTAMPPDISSELDKTSAKVDEVKGKMQSLLSSDNKITLNTDKLNEADTKLNQLKEQFNTMKLKADVEVNGTEKIDNVVGKTKEITEKMTGLFSGLKEKINEAVENSKTKINEFSTSVISALDSAATSAASAGSKFVDAFASGLGSNPAAVNAARDMAEEVLKNFHRSPPQKGPLAEHGDAARYSGGRFVESYAQGLRANRTRAGAAAGSVGEAALGGINTSSNRVNASGGAGGSTGGQDRFFGQLLDLTNFTSSIVDVFSKVSDTFFRIAKFMSDPLNKGTFFGSSLGYKKTVSDEELQRRENDKKQQAYTSMIESGTRNLDAFNESTRKVIDQQNMVSQPGTKDVGQILLNMFPEIQNIGGARQDSLPYHREGRALDVMIPNYDTPAGRALGDRINSYVLAHAADLGVTDTIWQNMYNPVGGTSTPFGGGNDPNQGHYNHIHITFAPGSKVDFSGLEAKTPEQIQQDAAKTALEALQAQYGPPPGLEGINYPTAPEPVAIIDSNGNWQIQTPHGKENFPGPGSINPQTGKPWTQEETNQFIKDNPLNFPVPEGMSAETLNQIRTNPEEFNLQKQEETIKSVADSNNNVAKALEIMQGDPRSASATDIANSLVALETEIKRQREIDTSGSRQTAQALETVQSNLMDATGFTKNENPIDTIAGIVSNAAGVASDIIGTVTTGIEAVGAADDIAKTLVRGVSNTKDVDRIIDNAQKFIELGGKIAGSVASVTGLISSITGAAGAGSAAGDGGGTAALSAALGSISTIASLIQAGFETANAVIDLTQEATRIIGSYVGDFLGYLVGGSNGQLTGTVRFLLDQQTNQLLAYSADNPMDKRIHNTPFASRDMASREQLIGNINVYGGPGSDPRDLTRQMMFQVNASQYAGALSQ